MGPLKKIISLTIIILVYISHSINARLILLNVVFRHGDRAPSRSESYPNDPYINETYFPYGYGGLTNIGKLREYRLGQFLRYRYGHFLGNTYLPEEVTARSTGFDRTKMSLHLVLAGMYPPAHHQQWNPMLDWQPVPTKYIPTLDDTLMVPQLCPKYLKLREQVEASPEFKERLSKFDRLMRYLSERMGKNVTHTAQMYGLYQGLLCQSELGLELPEWTYGIFPNGELHEGAVLEYVCASFNEDMKRLNGGMLLRKITDDMTDACVGKLDPPRKVFLYGGHEYNVAAVLQSLGVYRPQVPRYSSAVIVELHENDRRDQHFVRVRYYRGFVVTGRREILDEVMQVPGCKKFCALQRFKDVLKNVIATDDDIRSCDKRSLKEYLESGKSSLPRDITDWILDEIRAEESLRYVLQ